MAGQLRCVFACCDEFDHWRADAGADVWVACGWFDGWRDIHAAISGG
jgi:hypothetical protein